MSVTSFGGVFLPLTFFVFLFRRTWLLPLLCVAAVLQSPSVADLSWHGQTFGITPFMAVAGVIALDLLRRMPQRETGPDGSVPLLAWLWLAFAGFAILSALVLPWIFAGLPLHAPMAEDENAVAPLGWTVNHAAQIANMVLAVAIGWWTWELRVSAKLPGFILKGMLAAVAVSALVGVQQRLGWNGVLPLWDAWWASNPGYDQDYRAYAGPIPRVSWPFIEPSYASAWFAAALGGFIAMFAADRRRHAALLGIVITLAALGNSLGATGLLAAALFCAVLLPILALVALRRPDLRGGLVYRLTLAALVLTCLCLAGYLVLRNQNLVATMSSAFGSVLQGHSETVLGDIRPAADRQALQLIQETFGLGVGMGSYRASSYLINLACTVGVLGLLLFCVAFGEQLRVLTRRIGEHNDTAHIFFLGASVAGLIAVAIAIPDLNWPAFQMLLIGGFACAVSRDPPARPLA